MSKMIENQILVHRTVYDSMVEFQQKQWVCGLVIGSIMGLGIGMAYGVILAGALK